MMSTNITTDHQPETFSTRLLLRICLYYCAKCHACLSLRVWLCANALGCDDGKVGWERVIKRDC